MIDATAELEQIYGSDVCCGICGDTGYIWGKSEYGICERCTENTDMEIDFCDGEGI